MTQGQEHILIVDDDVDIRDLTARFLRKHGYRVTTARSGREMRQALVNADIDLITLDLMLPGEHGLTICRELRATSSIPIVMLTAMGADEDRIVGLEIGADDYVPKPFNARELLARIKAVLRRRQPTAEKGSVARTKVVEFAGWRLDLIRRELVSGDGMVVDLSAGEYDMLLVFLEHPQRVLSRDQLLDMARSRTNSPFDRTIDMQVSRLRRKIEPEASESALIKTVRGAGYIFTSSVKRL